MTSKIIGIGFMCVTLFACLAFSQTEALQPLRNQSADPAKTTGLGASVQFDPRGVNFGPWLQAFRAQIRRNWFIPFALKDLKASAEFTFYVTRDGTIMELRMTRSSGTPRFDSSALRALSAASPVQPLPAEYPDERVCFTIDFSTYPEAPGSSSNPGAQRSIATPIPASADSEPVIDDPRNLRDTSPAPEVFTIEGGTIYHRKNCISLVGHRKVKVADASRRNRAILAACRICRPDGPDAVPSGDAKRGAPVAN